MDRYSFELSIENTMWNGLGYFPRHSGSSTCATLWHFRGSGSAELKTEQLFSLQIVHHDQEFAVRRKADLVARRVDLVERHRPGVLARGSDRILALRILVELQECDRLEILLRVENADAAAQADHARGPTALRMPDRAVRAGQGQRRGTGQRTLFDEEFAHRDHLPVDLVTLGAAIVVLAGIGIGLDLVDGERATLDPRLAQLRHIGSPVELQRRLDLRRRAIEAGRDVLLPIGHEIGLRVLRVDRDMDPEPQASGFGDVFDELHLRAVETHAVDVG